jgi:hypothetical protein
MAAPRRVLAAIALLAACGASTSFREGVYRDGEARFRVGALDASWERLDLAQNDLAWRRDAAIIQVNATCDPFQDVPLTALTNHLFIGFRDRTIRRQERISLDGREALRTRAVASLDGVPRELLFVVLKKDACTYDFALIGPEGPAFAAALPAFDRFVGGFSTEGLPE